MADKSNAPFTRIDVPTSPNTFGTGTYLRLGAYVEGEESALMPGLSFSKSSATNTTTTAPSPTTDVLAALLSGQQIVTPTDVAEDVNAAAASSASTDGTASGNAKQGYLKRGDTFVKNKAGQMELMTISTKATTATSSGNGFLAKTDSDLNLNVGGGALIKIGKGQTTHVVDGDINFNAPAGIFAVSALSGVSITAGTAATPANLSLLAYGYVKQEAKGPVSEWLYSTSEKKTYGYAKDWFYGEKYSEFHGTSVSKFYGDEEKTFYGTSTSYFMGAQLTTNLAARINMTMAATLTLALGTEFRLNAAVDLKINLAVDINIIIGFGVKIVTPIDTKVVLGMDFKYVTGMDLKNVGIDAKRAAVSVGNKDLDAYLKALELKQGSIEVAGKPVTVGNGIWMRA